MDQICKHHIRWPHECKDCIEEDRQRFERQRKLYEDRNKQDIATGEMAPWGELTPEDQAAVCEKCGDITDPEMPFEDGETILCGGDECLNEARNDTEKCNSCNGKGEKLRESGHYTTCMACFGRGYVVI